MNSKEYVQNAVVTESRDFEAIKKRMVANSRHLLAVMNMAEATMDSQDSVKKHIFYGKDISVEHLMNPPNMEYDSEKNIAEKLSKEENIRLIHGAVGVLTEAGELQQQISNHIFRGEVLDKVNLVEEISDTFWYLAILCDTLNVGFEEVMEKNIAKLKARYPNKFSEEKALNRDLETERRILEDGPK